MDIIVTGAYGRVGTALLEYQASRFKYTPFDQHDNPEIDTIIGDISEYGQMKEAFKNRDGVVHLAADSNVDANLNSILQNNIIGGYNCLEACRETEVETAVLASSNHVVGMYEKEHAPQIYEKEHELILDNRSQVRPDSLYGTSKLFLEGLGRYYAENYTYPKQVYALRIGSVRYPKYDHPFGDAEAGVENGQWERESDEYNQQVKRMKATWQSRRDVASLIECCLNDDDVIFDIFYSISDNDRGWFDIEHAKTVVGYEPNDSGDEWHTRPIQTDTSRQSKYIKNSVSDC
jgi:nucleoside-diphosphate-sugar epimerase